MEIIFNFIIGFTGTIVGFIFGQRKSNAETDRVVIENVKQIISVYNQTIDDLKEEVAEMKKTIKEYEIQMRLLQIEMDKCLKTRAN